MPGFFPLFSVGGLIFSARPVFAGMPVPILGPEPIGHLVGLSTAAFLVAVVGAFLVKIGWNGAVRSTSLPTLTYRRAFCAALLGGLLFFLVLVMIAGSRELLTPGAWRPKGMLYELTDSVQEAPESASETAALFDRETLLSNDSSDTSRRAARYAALIRLRDALKKWSAEHNGILPPDIESANLPVEYWTIPAAGGLRYLYDPKSDTPVREPDFDPPALAFDRKGRIGERENESPQITD